MTVRINADDDRDDIRERIGATVSREDLRTSASRCRRLEDTSQRRTRQWDLSLDIDERHPTAHVDMEGDRFEIVVTGRCIEQTATSLDGKKWDYGAQRALSWHEAGHVLYTDHDDFRTRLKSLDAGDKGAAKQVWNALEDGAIETQLAERWRNAYDVLRVLRANLFGEEEPGVDDIERGGRVFPLAHATQALLLDDWMADVYDLTRDVRAKLLDPDDDEYHFANDEDRDIFVNEIVPEVDAVVPDVLSTPNAMDRNRRIFEFIDAVLPHITDAMADGKSQMNRDEQQSAEGMPDDASEGHSGLAQQDADALDDIDPDDIDRVVVSDSDDDDADPDEHASPSDVELPDDVEVDIEEGVYDQQSIEAGTSEDLLDELEAMSDVLDTGSDELVSDSVQFPTENWDADASVFAEARGGASVLAQLLRNRLQQERRSATQYNQRRGRFTGRGGATRRAQMGEKHVKQRTDEPDEKDYDFAFVIDRSGSMRSSMRAAEVAMVMLSLALEEVGVDTMVIEMYGNEARLAKPFGTPSDQHKSRLAHGEVSGSTPLADSVTLARERLRTEGENSYLVVVTDGAPDNVARFETAIEGCTMPTLGVNLTNGDEVAGMDEYDRAVAASPGDNLQQTLANLVQEVMF